MLNLFIYGTLLHEPIRKSLTSYDYPGEYGRLQGYAAKKVKGQSYPGLTAAPGACTRGMILFNVTPEDMQRLKDFEGAEYVLAQVKILRSNNEAIDCQAFLFHPGLLSRLSDEDWDFREFLNKDMEDFLENHEFNL